MTNVSKLGRHLTSAFGIADLKAYLGPHRSGDLNRWHLPNADLRIQSLRKKRPGKAVLTLAAN